MPRWRRSSAATRSSMEGCVAKRDARLPLMPIANALTFNCRAITLFIALMLGMPWLYWAAELTIFNALCIYMVCRHEAMCRKALLRLN